MKQKGLAVTLALLVSPISSWNINRPTHQQSRGWHSNGLVADSDRAQSGERCGVDKDGVACEDGLCCSGWGFCGKGPRYCAISVCQSGYGACETNGELPKIESFENPQFSYKKEKPLAKPKTKPSPTLNPKSPSKPIVDEVELAPEQTDDFSWEEEITEQDTWEEEPVQEFSRQANGRELFGSLPYGVEISSCSLSGVVALTFDDGPNPYLTGELLDLLDERGVKATFFVNGDNAGLITNPEKAQHVTRALASGHQIASHGWSHLSLDDVPYETKVSEITLLEDALESVMGRIPTYFRPPYGACNADCLSILEEYGYHAIRWDVDTNDWRQSLQESMNIVTSSLASMDSAIVLAHDIHEITVESLAAFMIDTAEREGLELVTLGACMDDPPENWYRDPNTGGRQARL